MDRYDKNTFLGHVAPIVIRHEYRTLASRQKTNREAWWALPQRTSLSGDDYLQWLKANPQPSDSILEEVMKADQHNKEYDALVDYIEKGPRGEFSKTQGTSVDAVILRGIRIDDFPVKEAQMFTRQPQAAWSAVSFGVVGDCVFLVECNRIGGHLIVTRQLEAVCHYLPQDVRLPSPSMEEFVSVRLRTAYFKGGIAIRKLHGLAEKSLERTEGQDWVARQMGLLQIREESL